MQIKQHGYLPKNCLIENVREKNNNVYAAVRVKQNINLKMQKKKTRPPNFQEYTHFSRYIDNISLLISSRPVKKNNQCLLYESLNAL